ncbi:MAG: type II toxin-antitoxin system HicB family antitoxin [Verrucomicrobiales bacterium]|jgi:predicted RNase H-like HicB family nuclease|nr:type II toxin-antitoxin system HicB family antitoxin [Verrucomicrobiales bacterium]
MHYPVILVQSEEGFAAGCPSLSGCWSQSATRAEALANIQVAIREVLAAKAELVLEQFHAEGARVELADVEVGAYA